jgi:hypothetical protein
VPSEHQRMAGCDVDHNCLIPARLLGKAKEACPDPDLMGGVPGDPRPIHGGSLGRQNTV